MNLKSPYEEILFATVQIMTQKATGTGFLVRIPSAVHDRTYTLLVSNKHVLIAPHEPIKFHFHRELNGEWQQGSEIIMESPNYSSVLTAHPNDIDLACLDVSFACSATPEIFCWCVSIEMMEDSSGGGVALGVGVSFVGYPSGIVDGAYGLPILRRGWVASIPSLDFDRRREFVIEGHIFPGSSGSPIFAEINGAMKLIGVAAGCFFYENKCSIRDFISINENMGLSHVIKAECVKELIVYARDKLDKNPSASCSKPPLLQQK